MADTKPSVKADQPKAKVYFHLYFCPSYQCLLANNPQRGSMHQRGVNSNSDKPLPLVKCLGCGGKMEIARNGMTDELGKDGKPTGNKVPHRKGHITEKNSEHDIEMHGDTILYEAPGQDSEDDVIAAENNGNIQ